MLAFHLLVLFGILAIGDCCAWYPAWTSWSACSQSCGGGTRSRNGTCLWGLDGSQTGKCNEFCYNGGTYSGGCQCSAWRAGRCCDSCQHIYIAHCKSGQQECGGSPDSIRCTECEDPYYSAGYGKGCEECPVISNCASRNCSAPDTVTCLICNEDNLFYKRTQSDTQCERMCAWDNHYCWPGECSLDNLKKDCRCAQGFHKVDTHGETSCQLNTSNAPSIDTCETTIMGPNGEMKRAKSSSASAACVHLEDFYGHIQPSYLLYDLETHFEVDISSVSKPAFINESNFGVTDITMDVTLHTVNGQESALQHYIILRDANQNSLPKKTVADKSNFSLPFDNQTLINGDWLCISYEAKAGGYLKSYDLRQAPLVASLPVPYTKTSTIRWLCYRYDSAKPEHCGASDDCSYEPLQISERITRSSYMPVRMQGWYDPIPEGGIRNHSSGIESFEIRLYEVVSSKGHLVVDTQKFQYEKIHQSSETVYLTLTSNTPRLYAIYIEVKDFADNVRQSRRFVLYDNSSYIETFPGKTFFIESASKESNYSWQIENSVICLNWIDYFYNKVYLDNPLLNIIEPDPSGLIQGYYDQTTGVLPISGTPNIRGIIGFKLSWAINNDTFTPEQDVLDFLPQHYCHNTTMNDGDTYTFRLKAKDIVNNTFVESRTVHIDHSVPEIQHIGVANNVKIDSEVNNSIDLSAMVFVVEAFDLHSGIKGIEWMFGRADAKVSLVGDHIDLSQARSSCKESPSCYCPNVGRCQNYKHKISLTKLAALGRHAGENNQPYSFKVMVTNNAMLSTEGRVDIYLSRYERETATTEKNSFLAPVLGGGVPSLLVGVVIGLLVVFIYRKKNAGKGNTQNSNSRSTDDEPVYVNEGYTGQVDSSENSSGESQYDTIRFSCNRRVYEGLQLNGETRFQEQGFENVSYQVDESVRKEEWTGDRSSDQSADNLEEFL